MKYFNFILILTLFVNPTLSFSNDQLEDDQNITLTKRIFNELRATNTEILDDFYDLSVIFEDPVGKISGLSSMKAYYKNMYKEVEEIRFDFKNIAKGGNIYFFSWNMWLKTPNLNKGEKFVVQGVSEIHFANNLVTYHRDYFDMGEMVYERIPIFGWVTKKIKNRLKHD